MTTTRPKRRPMNILKLFALSAGLGLAMGIGGVLVGETGFAPPPLAYAGAALLMGGLILWVGQRWWFSVDEGVREAHKISWFWGGSVALVVIGAVALFLLGITQGDAPGQYGITRADAHMLFNGISLTVGLLITGYGLWWAGWWFTRSR